MIKYGLGTELTAQYASFVRTYRSRMGEEPKLDFKQFTKIMKKLPAYSFKDVVARMGSEEIQKKNLFTKHFP
jgi:hypothetical protein